MSRAIRSLGAVGVVVLLASAACGNGGRSPADPEAAGPSLRVTSPAGPVGGNVLSLPVQVSGVRIVKADGDTSGRSGHFHVFVDRDPTPPGQAIPKEPGIVHSTDNPIVLSGLQTGAHRIVVVVGDGTHTRILPQLEESLRVEVTGPSVTASAPATIKPGEDAKLTVAVQGVQLVKADGDTSGKTGHLHYLVDPATPPVPGTVVPPAEPGKIVHSTEPVLSLSALGAGERTVWVVLGDGTHRIVDPLVASKVTVVVQ